MAPFKSSLAKSAGKLLGVFKEADFSLRGATQQSRKPQPALIATGGNQSPGDGLAPGNGYRYHTFTSSGSLVVTDAAGTAEILLVAGGGSGSGNSGYSSYGGGGAGALNLKYAGCTCNAQCTFQSCCARAKFCNL